MRLAFVLLVVACLVLRWADAGCGCAEHNGWKSLAAGVAGGPAAHEGHSHGDEPAQGGEPVWCHGCSAGGDPAVYVSASRVLAPLAVLATAGLERPVVAAVIEWPAAAFEARPLSRPVLQVYRI